MTTFPLMEKSQRLHPTSIRLTREQIAAVRQIARKERRTIGNTLRYLLSEAITARSGQKQVAA